MFTAALFVTPHPVPMSANILRPQFTVVSVWAVTWLIAAVISDHFEFIPHPPVQVAFVESWFIEPDASCTIKMSGGSLADDFGIAAHCMPPPVPGPPWAAPPPEPLVMMTTVPPPPLMAPVPDDPDPLGGLKLQAPT